MVTIWDPLLNFPSWRGTWAVDSTRLSTRVVTTAGGRQGAWPNARTQEVRDHSSEPVVLLLLLELALKTEISAVAPGVCHNKFPLQNTTYSPVQLIFLIHRAFFPIQLWGDKCTAQLTSQEKVCISCNSI